MSFGDLLANVNGPLNQLQGPPAPQQGGAPPPGPQQQGGASSSPSSAPQSPPDLAQLYIQMAQRERAANSIDRGLQMMVAANASPGMSHDLMNTMPQQQDAGGMIENLMRIQQMQQQNRNLQFMYNPAVAQDLANQLHIPLTRAQAIIASGQYGQIEGSSAGVGGDLNQRQYLQEKQGGLTNDDYLTWTQKHQAQGKIGEEEAANKAAASSDFNSVDPQWETVQKNLSYLNDPANRQDVYNAIKDQEWTTTGQTGKILSATGLGPTQGTLNAKSALDALQAQLKTEAFKGTKNVRSNREAQFLGDAATNLFKPTNSPQMIDDQLGFLLKQATRGRANATAAAGRPIPAEWGSVVDPQLIDPKSPLYNGSTVLPSQHQQGAAPQGPSPTAINPPSAFASPPQQGAAPAPAGNALSGSALAHVKDALARNPHDRDKILSTLKSNGYSTDGF